MTSILRITASAFGSGAFSATAVAQPPADFGPRSDPPTAALTRTPVNQVFQFMRGGTCSAWADGSTTKGTAYLWIPENCRKLRGLLIMGNNVPEHMLAGHPAIRGACAENNLGIIWSVPTFWSFAKGAKGQEHIAVDFLQQLLDALAKHSGYEEVATVPWLPIGESGHLLMVCGLVDQRPTRCIAAICVKNPHQPADLTVPMLWTLGTAQEWGQSKTDIRESWRNITGGYERWVAGRAASGWPLSILIEPGTGHFACTDRMAEYFGKYISAACKARLSGDGSPTLRPVLLDTGFLADLPVPGHALQAVSRHAETPADDRRKPWFFDEATAREAQEIATTDWNAGSQLPGFTGGANCTIKPFSFNSVTEITVTTDSEFTVSPAFIDAIPEGFVGAGEKLAVPPGRPAVEWICGPVAPVGDGRFRIALDRTWKTGAACYLVARHDGTPGIRPGVQPAAVKLVENCGGAPQTITFGPIPDVKEGTPSVELSASSDSGLPVGFYVESGPAVVQDGRVVFTKIPPRTRFPVEITIAAWQWGSHREPKVDTAAIVKRTFRMVR